ncbi:hypothetical protein J6590_051908 [Homalodisca vitripennis]|nr:hypothetical protein J6590_051908 [Homalodisca vitripennis]
MPSHILIARTSAPIASHHFNNVVWTRLPKNVFVGRKTLELGVYDAIITFNNGNLGRLEVFKHLGISDIGSNTIDALKKIGVRSGVGIQGQEARVKSRRVRFREEEVDDTEYCPGRF